MQDMEVVKVLTPAEEELVVQILAAIKTACDFEGPLDLFNAMNTENAKKVLYMVNTQRSNTLARVRGERDTLRKQVWALKEQMKALQEEATQMKALQEETTGKVQDQEDQIVNLMGLVEELRTECIDRDAFVQNLQKELAELENTLATMVEEHELASRHLMEQHEVALTVCEMGYIAKLDGVTKNLCSQLKAMELALADAQLQATQDAVYNRDMVAHLRKEIATLTEAFNERVDTIAQLHTDISENEKDVAATMERLQQANAELAAKLATAQAKCSAEENVVLQATSDKAVAELSTKVAALEQELTASKQAQIALEERRETRAVAKAATDLCNKVITEARATPAAAATSVMCLRKRKHPAGSHLAMKKPKRK